MQCVRCMKSSGFSPSIDSLSRALSKTTLNLSSRRTFTSFLGPSRPALLSSPFKFSPTTSSMAAPLAPAETIDLHSKISSHPALGALQVRGAKRDTFSPSHFVRKRRHGFLSRIKTRKGRNTIKRRLLKKRSTLSH